LEISEERDLLTAELNRVIGISRDAESSNKRRIRELELASAAGKSQIDQLAKDILQFTAANAELTAQNKALRIFAGNEAMSRKKFADLVDALSLDSFDVFGTSEETPHIARAIERNFARPRQRPQRLLEGRSHETLRSPRCHSQKN
jgi:hypothetical protein